MKDDDYVETSDAEELEEFRALDKPSLRYDVLVREGDIYRRDDFYSPRKRIKFDYDNVTVNPQMVQSPRATPLQLAPRPYPDTSAEKNPSISIPQPSSPTGSSDKNGLLFTPLSSRFGSPSPTDASRLQTSVVNNGILHAISNTPSRSQAIEIVDVSSPSQSQDPLLLFSQVQRRSSLDTLNSSKSPSSISHLPEIENEPPPSTSQSPGNASLGYSHSSPTPSRRQSPSCDPLSLFGYPSDPAPVDSDMQVDHDNSVHHASTTPSPRPPNRPHTRTSARETTPMSPLTPSPSQSPSQAPSVVEAQVMPAQNLSTSPGSIAANSAETRYPLRPRNRAQIQPFTVEALIYRNTLKTAPEAIVKIRGVDDRVRSRHETERNEDSQDTEYFEDTNDRSQEEEDIRRHRPHSKSRTRSPEADNEVLSYPGLELPSEDEEEERAMQKMYREGRKIIRERERKQKEKEREEKERQRQLKEREHKKTRSFPLSKERADSSREAEARSDDKAASRRGGRSPSRTSRVSTAREDSPSSFVVGFDSSPRRSRSPHLANSPTLDATDQHILDYYGHDDYQTLDNDGIHYHDDGAQETFNIHPVYEQDDSVQFIPLPNHEDDILRNTRETAIDLSSESDVDEDPSDKRSSPNSTEEAIRLDSKQKKALSRMYPAFMTKRMLREGSAGISSGKSSVSRPGVVRGEDEGHGPLRPGQTRVRMSSNPKDIHEIKGDTESSSDDDDKSVMSEADDGVGRYHRIKKPHRHVTPEHTEETFEGRHSPEIISIESDTTESDDEPEVLDDEDLQAYLKDEDISYVGSARVKRMREASLIDWMLSRARTVGTEKEKRKRDTVRSSGRGTSSSSKYKLDVVTRDARQYGHGKQSLLDFSNHKKHRAEGIRPERKRKHSRSSNDRESAVASGNRDARNMHTEKDHIDQIPPAAKDHPKSWKQLQKERRAKAKKQGLYTFGTGNGSRIETGRRRGTAFITVDLEDEGFHQALAPLSQKRHSNWAEAFRPPSQDRSRHKRHTDAVASQIDDNAQRSNEPSERGRQRPKQRQIQGDLDIPILHSGMNFALDTFIGKGFLHELVKIITSAIAVPSMPSELSLQGFELKLNMNTDAFCEKVGDICQQLFEFATGLESATNPEASKEYTLLMRTVCQLLSWHLHGGTDADKANIREQVKTHILRLTSRIREAEIPKTLLDNTFLSVCWFSVELSCRLGINHSFSRPPDRFHKSPLLESCDVLVHYLLDFGLQHTMEPVRSGDMAGSDISLYSAELWVSLIHVLDALDYIEERTGKRVHPFWKVVMDVLRSEKYVDKPNIQVSEIIWRAIFSLCALSQFSVHGMTTSIPRVPACWELVVEALKKIRLTSKPEVDQQLDATSLNKRDQYIGLVTTRCFHLWDRWYWKLDDASVLFNQLVEIFRSRKFSNLRNEEADYPLFMRQRKWELLSSYSDEDTAFTQFLKLIYHAAKIDGPLDAKGELKPKCKKLLSLAVPVGVLPFTKASPPTRDNLSMLYNRFSAVAIAISLDPERYMARIAQARSYVNFADVDDTTRFGVMTGVVSFGILMVKAKIKLDGIAGWIEDLSGTLAKEMKEVPDSSFTNKAREREHSSSRLHLFLAVQMLIGTVRQIVDSLRECNEYPEPMLLENLKTIFRARNFADIPKVAEEIRALTTSYLTARAAVVPPPQHPKGTGTSAEADEETQESQDYSAGNFSDFDFDDPSLIAALDGVAPEATAINCSVEDTALRKAIYASNLQWLCFRFMRKYFSDPPPGTSFTSYAEECDKWINCWLGCANVDKCSGNKQAWQSCIDMRQNTWGKESSQYWQRRIDLGVMHNILELDPMAYETFSSKVTGIVLESLIADHVTIEGSFVASVFSLDGSQHPLFRHATCVTRNDDGDLYISAEEFKALRIPLLHVVLGNLNRRMQDDNGLDPTVTLHNQEYIGLCIRMFSTMRAIVEKLKVNNNDDYREYINFCREVFQMTQQHREVRLEARLQYWWNWGRTLEPT